MYLVVMIVAKAVILTTTIDHKLKKQQQPQVRNVPRLDRLPDPSKEGAGQLHREQQQHHVVQMSQAVQEATRVDSLLISFPNPLASGSGDSVLHIGDSLHSSAGFFSANNIYCNNISRIQMTDDKLRLASSLKSEQRKQFLRTEIFLVY